MAGAIHKDLTTVADALTEALRRIDFLAHVLESQEVEALAPEEFLAEVMSDIGCAMTKLQHINRRYACECQDGSQG